MTLRFMPTREPVAPAEPTAWDRRVLDLIARYPRAWHAFVDFTLSRVDEGETRVGAKAAWEHMRYRARAELRERGDRWALDNSLCASFPRIFVATYPEFPVFETRKRPTERRAA